MQKPKILILGGDGMLGFQLWRYLISQGLNPITTVRKSKHAYLNAKFIEHTIFNLSLDNIENLLSVFEKIKPSFVINCIGVIKQRQNALDIPEMIEVNALLPHKIAVLCNLCGAKLIQISTDCVFDGKLGNYTENDIPNALDLYGITKSLGEVKSDINTLTLRTSIIGRENFNHTSLFEWFINQNNNVKGFKNAFFSGLTTLELSKVIYTIITSQTNLQGLFQVVGEKIDKYSLLTKIARIFNKTDIIVIPDEKFHIDRSLDGSLFEQEMEYQKKSWDRMLTEMKNFELDFEWKI